MTPGLGPSEPVGEVGHGTPSVPPRTVLSVSRTSPAQGEDDKSQESPAPCSPAHLPALPLSLASGPGTLPQHPSHRPTSRPALSAPRLLGPLPRVQPHTQPVRLPPRTPEAGASPAQRLTHARQNPGCARLEFPCLVCAVHSPHNCASKPRPALKGARPARPKGPGWFSATHGHPLIWSWRGAHSPLCGREVTPCLGEKPPLDPEP